MPSSNRSNAGPPNKRHSPSTFKSLFNISINLLMIVIPTVAFSAILLTLIYCYRVHYQQNLIPGLQSGGDSDEPGVYYVNLNAATLVFIASWSSTVAMTMTGFFVTLLGYPLARMLLHQSDAAVGNGGNSLPSPHHFAAVVTLLAGARMKALRSFLQLTLPGAKGNRGAAATSTFLGFLVSFLLA